jgi:kynurenine formamidase
MDSNQGAKPLSRSDFDQIFATCSNRGKWGKNDELGALNYLTPELIVQASKLVRTGRTVSCAWELDTQLGLDNPNPVKHEISFGWDTTFGDSGDLRIAGDRFSMDIHGDAHSHLDALCHVGFAGEVYNGVPLKDAIDTNGALKQSVNLAKNGIVTRGVLIDMPRFRKSKWIEPGEAILPEEFLAAEAATGTKLRTGDMLLFRTGHARKRSEEGPWDAANKKAGIHSSVLQILSEREIVGVGYDGDGEAVPSNCEGVTYPIHAISIPAMGLWTMDSLNLEALSKTCIEENRWEFFLTISPLRITKGTGSPVNPIAIF